MNARSKKQQFIDISNDNLDKDLIELTLVLPDDSVEILLNNNVKNKCEYVLLTYNEALQHKNDNRVQIIDYRFLDE